MDMSKVTNGLVSVEPVQIIKEEEKKYQVISSLKEKVAELQNLLPDDVFNMSDFYFAGGCIYSLWNNVPPKDYDIFCRNKRAIKKIKAYFKRNKDKASSITKNAITFGEFQFITRHIGEPETVVSEFDFRHNMFYFDGKSLETLSSWRYLDDNKLAFNTERARDILNVVLRTPKFVSRGMEISKKDMAEILEKGTRPRKILKERRGLKNTYRNDY